MKFAALSIAFCLGISCLAEAAPKTAEIFKGVSFAKPQCYGREYSKAELASHPKQTVEQIKAKLVKYSSDPKKLRRD